MSFKTKVTGVLSAILLILPGAGLCANAHEFLKVVVCDAQVRSIFQQVEAGTLSVEEALTLPLRAIQREELAVRLMKREFLAGGNLSTLAILMMSLVPDVERVSFMTTLVIAGSEIDCDGAPQVIADMARAGDEDDVLLITAVASFSAVKTGINVQVLAEKLEAAGMTNVAENPAEVVTPQAVQTQQTLVEAILYPEVTVGVVDDNPTQLSSEIGGYEQTN